eukprot:Plantae.Rhodophyta-Hildenbrandia_rubra.ctg3626.p1 GENE.Plantae.Rhodophyta-Hildenbrandia_rubra.ctg3626~~Plantae.Rhodophyta-Hildenbrandia_rubra.ctg3626.p1  ORF type:complete len:950 (+),score=141.74 Plantae.Rhodophyta-Hildenbrandia_rubra.ctg3626:3234-6083(+)
MAIIEDGGDPKISNDTSTSPVGAEQVSTYVDPIANKNAPEQFGAEDVGERTAVDMNVDQMKDQPPGEKPHAIETGGTQGMVGGSERSSIDAKEGSEDQKVREPDSEKDDEEMGSDVTGDKPKDALEAECILLAKSESKMRPSSADVGKQVGLSERVAVDQTNKTKETMQAAMEGSLVGSAIIPDLQKSIELEKTGGLVIPIHMTEGISLDANKFKNTLNTLNENVAETVGAVKPSIVANPMVEGIPNEGPNERLPGVLYEPSCEDETLDQDTLGVHLINLDDTVRSDANLRSLSAVEHNSSFSVAVDRYEIAALNNESEKKVDDINMSGKESEAPETILQEPGKAKQIADMEVDPSNEDVIKKPYKRETKMEDAIAPAKGSSLMEVPVNSDEGAMVLIENEGSKSCVGRSRSRSTERESETSSGEATSESESTSDTSSNTSGGSSESEYDSDSSSFTPAVVEEPPNLGGEAPLRTKNEMAVEALPIKPIDFEVLPEHSLKKLGRISSIVDGRMVVIESEQSKSESKRVMAGAMREVIANAIAVDIDSPVVFEDRVPLGRVFDTFGPVQKPFYTVRSDISREEASQRLKVGACVFYISDLSKSVRAGDLHSKGYDCSNLYDEEIPLGKQEFSDDEAESYAKRALKNKNRRRPSAKYPQTKRRPPSRFSNPRQSTIPSMRERHSAGNTGGDTAPRPLRYQRGPSVAFSRPTVQLEGPSGPVQTSFPTPMLAGGDAPREQMSFDPRHPNYCPQQNAPYAYRNLHAQAYGYPGFPQPYSQPESQSHMGQSGSYTQYPWTPPHSYSGPARAAEENMSTQRPPQAQGSAPALGQQWAQGPAWLQGRPVMLGQGMMSGQPMVPVPPIIHGPMMHGQPMGHEQSIMQPTMQPTMQSPSWMQSQSLVQGRMFVPRQLQVQPSSSTQQLNPWAGQWEVSGQSSPLQDSQQGQNRQNPRR